VVFRHGRRFPIDANGLVDFRPRGVREAPPFDEINAALRFLKQAGIAHDLPEAHGKTIAVSSYELKHLIERRVGQYLSNGSVIIATLLADCNQREKGVISTRIVLPADFVNELRARH
jgi:hypothetical protein